MPSPLLRLAFCALAVVPACAFAHDSARVSPSEHSGTCAGAIQQPIEAQVLALDPVRRGATVRLRVVATSKPGVGRAEARLVHTGSARAVGATRQALGALDPRTTREATFQVVVPSNGTRALVQFVIEGEGANGRVTRGVAFNLLPDGPTQLGRSATTGDGTRVIEYEARRVEP